MKTYNAFIVYLTQEVVDVVLHNLAMKEHFVRGTAGNPLDSNIAPPPLQNKQTMAYTSRIEILTEKTIEQVHEDIRLAFDGYTYLSIIVTSLDRSVWSYRTSCTQDRHPFPKGKLEVLE